MSAETDLRAEWGRIWTAGGAKKTHIMPACPYVTDRFTAVDVENYPESHVDLCKWCARRFETWDANRFDTNENVGKCERCGCRTNNAHYCRDCQTHVERMRARK